MSKPPGESRDPVAAAIEAEITDHLATAAERFESQGLAFDEARRASQKRFGDPAAIRRRCYWVKQGDALMFRAAVILLLSVVCLVLGAALFANWRTQRQMADQMVALAEQLKTLAEQQRGAPAPPAPAAEPKPLDIGGYVFFGAGDKPAVGSEVMICRAGDGEIVRRVVTGADGTFRSGPLTAGDYSLVAKGVKGSTWPSVGIQTAPLYVYPGMQPGDVALNAMYRAGRIAVELSRPLPSLEVAGKYKLESRLYLEVTTTQMQTGRWTAAQPMPARWPIYISMPDRQHAPSRGSSARTAVLDNAELGADSGPVKLGGSQDLPAGPCSLAAAIYADVLPADFEVVSGAPGSSLSSQRIKLIEEWMSDDYVRQHSMGAAWLGKLKRMNGPYDAALPGLSRGFGRGTPLDFHAQEFVAHLIIGDGATTRLRIEVPADIESRIERLLETVTDPNEFEQSVQQDNPFIRQAKITVLDSEPAGDGPRTASAAAADRDTVIARVLGTEY